MKSAVKLNRLLSKLYGYSGKFLQRQCKIQLSRDNLEEQKVLESTFFRLSKSLKSTISANIVPPPGQTSHYELLGDWNVCHWYTFQWTVTSAHCKKNYKNC